MKTFLGRMKSIAVKEFNDFSRQPCEQFINKQNRKILID